MASFSSIASLSYFTLYTLFMIFLALYVYHTQKHSLNKTFLKSVYQQRKIYAQILVHFYDTATDVGVLITWYQLYADEMNGIDYFSVDMGVFFWGGCGVLTFYRVFNVMLTIYDTSQNTHKYSSWRANICTEIIMWFGLLTAAVLDLFIFFTVYESFIHISHVNEENETRARRLELKQTRKTDALAQISAEVGNGQTLEDIVESKFKIELAEIEPAWAQSVCMFAESVIESMPQVVLQSVFLIRSTNDPRLSSKANLFLIVMSLIASILSISNKFYKIDKKGVIEQAKSMKLKLHFPVCVQPWYLVRIVWRFAHILCRFIIFSLAWIVLGGAFMSMYIALTICFYVCSLSLVWGCTGALKDGWMKVIFGSVLGTVGTPIYSNSCVIMVPKWVDTVLMLIVITLFANTHWNCDICAGSETRQMSKNAAILSFLIMGYVSWALDIILFSILNIFGIISETAELGFATGIDKYVLHRDIILGFLRKEDDIETFWKRFAVDETALDRESFDDILFVSLQLFCVARDPDMPPPSRDAIESFIEKLGNELAPRIDSSGAGVINFEEFKTFGVYIGKEWAKLKIEALPDDNKQSAEESTEIDGNDKETSPQQDAIFV